MGPKATQQRKLRKQLVALDQKIRNAGIELDADHKRRRLLAARYDTLVMEEQTAKIKQDRRRAKAARDNRIRSEQEFNSQIAGGADFQADLPLDLSQLAEERER